MPLNDVRKLKNSRSFSGSDIDLKEGGEFDTVDYRIQAVSDVGKSISLWHDVSLVHLDPDTRSETPYFNFVCEISKFTRYVVFSSPSSRHAIVSLRLNKAVTVTVTVTYMLIKSDFSSYQKEIRDRN